MDWTFATPEPVELSVELHAGSLTVLAEARRDTVVSVTGLRSELVIVEQRGRSVVVRPPKEWRDCGKQDIHIGVPLGGDVRVRSGSARVELEAISGGFGEVSVKTGSGAIRLDGARTIALSTGSGNVSCAQVGAELRALSGSGDVGVGRLDGRATISTGSGDVRVDQVEGTLAVKTGSGELSVGRLSGEVRFGTASGLLTVERAERGRIDAKSASGGVRLGIVAGTPVWTEIATALGRVESHLPRVGEPSPGQDHISVRVRSASGRVVLVPIDAGPQDAPPGGPGGPGRPGWGRRGTSASST